MIRVQAEFLCMAAQVADGCLHFTDLEGVFLQTAADAGHAGECEAVQKSDIGNTSDVYRVSVSEIPAAAGYIQNDRSRAIQMLRKVQIQAAGTGGVLHIDKLPVLPTVSVKLQRYDFPLGIDVKVLSCRHNLLVILCENPGEILQTGIDISAFPVDQVELVMCIIRQNGKIADIFGVAQMRQRHLRCKCNAHIDGYRFQSALPACARAWQSYIRYGEPSGLYL